MPAPSTPLTPVPPGHGIVLDPATRMADEGHLLLGGRPTRVVRLSSPQVSVLLRWMSGATPAEPEARALAARLVAAGLAHPAPPGAAHRKNAAPDEVSRRCPALTVEPGDASGGPGVLWEAPRERSARAGPLEAAPSGGSSVPGESSGPEDGAPGADRAASRVPRTGDVPIGAPGSVVGQSLVPDLGFAVTPEEASGPDVAARADEAPAGAPGDAEPCPGPGAPTEVSGPDDGAPGADRAVSGGVQPWDVPFTDRPGTTGEAPAHGAAYRERPGTSGTPRSGGSPAGASGEPAGSDEGAGRDDLLVLAPSGVCPEPGWLVPALAHLDDPRVGAVVPGVVVDEQDRGDAGPLRAALAALLTRLTLPGAPCAPAVPGASRKSGAPGQPGAPVATSGNAFGHTAEQAVEHACDDPPHRVPALVVRRSALPAPGATPPAPEAGPAHLPPAGVHSRTLPPTLPGTLAAAGWSVRHEPRSRVRVEPLRGFGAYLSACFDLGVAAGERPGPAAGDGECRAGVARTRAAGPRVSWVGVAALALALSGRPAGGACVALAGYTAAAAAHRLPPKIAVRAVGACVSDDARALGRAAEQGWAPVAGALALRHPVAAAAVVASAALAGRSTPARSAAVTAGAVARSVGTWWGAWRGRSVASLVPRVHTPLAARSPSRR